MSDLHITYGDKIKTATDPDGYPAVRVHNQAWVEDPRWLTIIDGHDGAVLLDDLIAALTDLRARRAVNA